MCTCVCVCTFLLPLTAAGGTGTGVRGEGSSGFTSCFSSSSGSSGGGGGGRGARLGHWPISAFSKDTGCEKSERLTQRKGKGNVQHFALFYIQLLILISNWIRGFQQSTLATKKTSFNQRTYNHSQSWHPWRKNFNGGGCQVIEGSHKQTQINRQRWDGRNLSYEHVYDVGQLYYCCSRGMTRWLYLHHRNITAIMTSSSDMINQPLTQLFMRSHWAVFFYLQRGLCLWGTLDVSLFQSWFASCGFVFQNWRLRNVWFTP